MLQDFEYINCSCGSIEHVLRFGYDPEEKEIWVEYYISAEYLNFFQRFWMGLKYIFGAKAKYGHFDTTIIRNEDIPKIIKMFKECE